MDDKKISKLKELSELYKSGILSKEELDSEKNKLLHGNQESNVVDNLHHTGNNNPRENVIDEPQSQVLTNLQSKEKINNYDDDESSHSDEDENNGRSINAWFENNRQKLYYFGGSLIILIGIWVFFGLYQHRQNQIAIAKEREQARLDSIAEVERLIAQHREDSIRRDAEIRNFTSPDLQFFNLHGKIKSITSKHTVGYFPFKISWGKLYFNQNGECTNLNVAIAKQYDKNPKNVELSYNKKGELIKSQIENWVNEYKWDDKKIISYIEHYVSNERSYRYFDVLYANSDVIEVKEFGQYSYGGNYLVEYKYSDFKKDSYGNSIEFNWEYERYKIEYKDYDSYIKLSRTDSSHGITTRLIEYYD